MTWGYDRFKREMERAKDAGLDLVLIVEVPISEVGRGHKHSKWPGPAMVKKLGTLRERYGLETVYSASRSDMAYYIRHRFEAKERLGEAGSS